MVDFPESQFPIVITESPSVYGHLHAREMMKLGDKAFINVAHTDDYHYSMCVSFKNSKYHSSWNSNLEHIATPVHFYSAQEGALEVHLRHFIKMMEELPWDSQWFDHRLAARSPKRQLVDSGCLYPLHDPWLARRSLILPFSQLLHNCQEQGLPPPLPMHLFAEIIEFIL